MRWSVLFVLMLASAGATPLRSLTCDNYRIQTDLEQTLGEDIAHRLDAMHDEFSRRLSDFSSSRGNTQLEVYLFAKEKDYTAFTGNRAANSGGAFMPERGVLAAYCDPQGRDALRKALQHEAFHQFAHARISPSLPPWLNEGLAVVFEEGIWTGGGFELGEVPPHRVRQLHADIGGHRLTGFREFMSMDLRRWNELLANEPSLGAAQYNQAWAMVHFLVFDEQNGRPRYRQRFIEMLRLIHEGVAPDAAFAQALSPNVNNFQSRFDEFASRIAPTPRAMLIERQEVLGDLLIQLRQAGQRYQRVADFREDVLRNRVRLRYSRGEVRWTTDADPAAYFRTADGRLLRDDELFFETRTQSPLPDLVYRGPGPLKLRTRFYDLGDAVRREILVEGKAR